MKRQPAKPLTNTCGGKTMEAKTLFQLHLELLRKKTGASYLAALCNLANIPADSIGFGADPEAGDRRIQAAIERYRPRFYEWLADELLKHEKAREAEIRKAIAEETERLTKGLKVGRVKGANSNRVRAAAIKALVAEIDQDLLSRLWSIPRRASYIAKELGGRTIEVNGERMRATMANGREYSAETIKRWISGGKKRAQEG